MKKHLSSLDLYYMTKELQVLIDAKMDKVFAKDLEFLFQMHIPNKGKTMMRVLLPDLIYLTETKGEFPQPGKFCMTLRKYIGNSRLRVIKQHKFERILEFVFEKKEHKVIVIIELFSKGNLVLCKEDYTIIVAKDYQKWSQRTIRGGIKYEFPKRDVDPQNIELKEFKNTIESSDKESIVKTLAIEFSLGGTYAEEVCSLAKIDKDSKSLKDKDVIVLYSALKNIFEQKIAASKYIKEITPISLDSQESIETYESFSQALDQNIKFKEKKPDEDKQKEKILKIISQQENMIKGLEKQANESHEKAEAIYHHYKEIEEILREINKARKKYSWKEIKEKLKDHKVIKKINEKQGKISLDLAV